MGSVARMTKPYRAAVEGRWQEVKSFYKKHKELVNARLTATGDTALHVAVYNENTDLLESLVQIILEMESVFSPFHDESTRFQIKNDYGHTALHLAAGPGNLAAAELLLHYDKNLLPLKNNKGETALFRAAAFGRTRFVKLLASKVQDMEPHVKREDRTSILHIAILGGYFETAVELLKLGVSPDIMDENGITGFQLLANISSAFKSGYPMGKLKALLYYCLPEVDYAENTEDEFDSGQQVIVGEKNQDLETGRPKKSTQAADSSSAISSAYNTFWRSIARGFPSIKKVWGDKKKHTKALELATILAKTDLSWHYLSSGADPSETISTSKHDKEGDEEKKKEDEGDDSKTSFLSETPLIAAAGNGILEIVKAILRVYPQAIEHVNNKKENIFHVVARHRRTEILDLLQSPAVVVPISRLRRKININGDSILHNAAYLGSFSSRDRPGKPLECSLRHRRTEILDLLQSPAVVVPISRLRRKININGDSILHNAAYLGSFSSRDRPGEALRMQSEIQWYKRVQEIVPPYFINHLNNNDTTAHELFTEKHKKLMHDGQEWLMRTAQACTLVAVLIATVAFTCAYTVPGGFNKAGHPLLLKTTPFSVFATSDALSLCFSLTSVVVFLSIMTSTMNEQDFRRYLPLKLVLGLSTLFFSVAAMMVAFSATLVLMIRQRLHWAAIPIYTIACCPVTIFLILQFPLYLNIAWFTVKDSFASS